jgi:hypothetical protein
MPEPVFHDDFERRIIEGLRRPAPASPIRYWSPTLVSCAVAAAAVVMALQFIRSSTSVPVPGLGTSEARNAPPSYRQFPAIDLTTPPIFSR